MSHGTETGHTAERKAGEATHTEVIRVLGSKFMLELPVHLVTAERGSNDGGLISVSSTVESSLDLIGQVSTLDCSRECSSNLCFSLFGRVKIQNRYASDLNAQEIISLLIFCKDFLGVSSQPIK